MINDCCKVLDNLFTVALLKIGCSKCGTLHIINPETFEFTHIESPESLPIMISESFLRLTERFTSKTYSELVAIGREEHEKTLSQT